MASLLRQTVDYSTGLWTTRYDPGPLGVVIRGYVSPWPHTPADRFIRDYAVRNLILYSAYLGGGEWDSLLYMYFGDLVGRLNLNAISLYEFELSVDGVSIHEADPLRIYETGVRPRMFTVGGTTIRGPTFGFVSGWRIPMTPLNAQALRLQWIWDYAEQQL